MKYCDERVYVSICIYMDEHISKTRCPNFAYFSVHVACGRSSVLSGAVLYATICVLPVLWMTSRFHIMARHRRRECSK